VLSNVFFDLNQSKIRETSKIELLEFVAFLKQNPQHKIELGGHTDSRGNSTDNLILSSERAKSVFDFLISNGINANRLSYKGYGSTQTIISDVEIEKMNSEEEKEKVKGSKILILNALRKQDHPTHFNLDQAIALATELKVPTVYFIHFSHQIGLHDQVEASLPPGMHLAYDGLGFSC